MDPAYEDHLVVYIDLLGFSAHSFTDVDKKMSVLALLKDFAALRGDYQHEVTTHEGGGRTVKIIPSVSAFSDSVVISYPISKLKRDADSIPIWLFLNRLMAFMLSRALPLGLLIRGGITVGPLYHSGGVVFGEALIEAHKLESTVAIYPRIVVTPQAEKYLAGMLAEDADGLRYFDYLRVGILSFALPGDTFTKELQGRVATSQQVITTNIQALTNATDLCRLAKWHWFARYFNTALRAPAVQAVLRKSATER